MQMGILITDNGPHPPDKWAVATAEHIFPISPMIAKDRLMDAKKIQLAIAEALVSHHGDNIAAEQSALAARGADRFGEPFTPEDATQKALETVVSVMANSPWKDKTLDPEWQGAVRSILASHFATAQQIERQWHAHRNPGERSDAFLAKIHSGV